MLEHELLQLITIRYTQEMARFFSPNCKTDASILQLGIF